MDSREFRDAVIDRSLESLVDQIAKVEQRAMRQQRVLGELCTRLGLPIPALGSEPGPGPGPPSISAERLNALKKAWRPMVSYVVFALVRSLAESNPEGNVLVNKGTVEGVGRQLDRADLLNGTGFEEQDLTAVLGVLPSVLETVLKGTFASFAIDGRLYTFSSEPRVPLAQGGDERGHILPQEEWSV